MLPMMAKKPNVTVIVGKLAEKQSENGEVMSDCGPAMEGCAQKMLQAFESKDSKALVSALKDFISIYEMEEDKAEEMSEEG